MTSGDVFERIAAAVERESEADDVLRAVVTGLAEAPGAVWAGVALVEAGELVLGPESGRPDEDRRTSVPITFGGDPVGELRVDGDTDRAMLVRVAELLSPYVLIGWDTGGEAWEP